MKKGGGKVKLINILVLLLTLGCFIYNYQNIAALFYGKAVWFWLVLAFTALTVHALKALRLYLTIYGVDINLISYLKIYCKVTPASMVLPFKLGEFFRMYCYGCELQNMLKGIVSILLDRFMDTMALVTAILIVCIFQHGRLSAVIYFLVVFLLMMLLIYFVYPGLYKYWKLYLLRAAASEKKLLALNWLEKLQRIYAEIETVVRGKGVILYFLSLIAWSVEIGYVVLLNMLTDNADLNHAVSIYLSSSTGLVNSSELQQFVFISVIGLLLLYIILKLYLIFRKKCER